MPSKSANVKNEKQYEALKDTGMSKERAARIANSPGASSRGGTESGARGDSSQDGTTAQKKRTVTATPQDPGDPDVVPSGDPSINPIPTPETDPIEPDSPPDDRPDVEPTLPS